MERFLGALAGLARTRIATVGGRYYAMDRDKRWERIEKAYGAMTEAKAPRFDDPLAAIRASYGAGKTDEFMPPAVIGDYRGMTDGDGVMMANFRADRARQILAALLFPDFDGFARAKTIRFAAATGLT
jgi:2,3-bisphosphoglycerate-independent phosphoglycerate mutase